MLTGRVTFLVMGLSIFALMLSIFAVAVVIWGPKKDDAAVQIKVLLCKDALDMRARIVGDLLDNKPLGVVGDHYANWVIMKYEQDTIEFCGLPFNYYVSPVR